MCYRTSTVLVDDSFKIQDSRLRISGHLLACLCCAISHFSFLTALAYAIELSSIISLAQAQVMSHGKHGSCFLILCVCTACVLLSVMNDIDRHNLRSTSLLLGHSSRRHLLLNFDPKTITAKTPPPGTIAVVMNTPKCGTTGLADMFARSFDCRGKSPQQTGEVLAYSCPEQRTLVRTHDYEGGVQVLQSIREQQEPNQKCIVVTAIRNPETWLSSLYMQSADGYALCQAEISVDDFVQRYRNWIVQNAMRVRAAVESVRPRLLRDFGATSLTSEMEKIQANGGYSLLKEQKNSNFNGGRPFGNCELLFLRMEDHDKWPQIMDSVMPGLVDLVKSPARTETCPVIAEHYGAIQNYKLTEDEKVSIIGGNVHVEEYFRVYGLI